MKIKWKIKLDPIQTYCYICHPIQNDEWKKLYRGVEQLVARRAHNPKVAGSSPVPATETVWSLSTECAVSSKLFLCPSCTNQVKTGSPQYSLSNSNSNIFLRKAIQTRGIMPTPGMNPIPVPAVGFPCPLQ